RHVTRSLLRSCLLLASLSHTRDDTISTPASREPQGPSSVHPALGVPLPLPRREGSPRGELDNSCRVVPRCAHKVRRGFVRTLAGPELRLDPRSGLSLFRPRSDEPAPPLSALPVLSIRPKLPGNDP